MEPTIRAQNLSKQFGDHRALDGVDFSVPAGSVYGFLGPNGAGKTTAIKVLLGLIAASAGRAEVLGREVTLGSAAHYLNRVGYLPQDPVFPDGLTGEEALDLVADIYRLDRAPARARIRDLLDQFGLSDAARRKVSAYSRGMKQRLGIAAVLLPATDLLVLDEPVSALDPEGRKTVLEQIASLRGSATVFLSSHILADVERVCDRICIINRGQKLVENETAAVLDEYALEQYVVGVDRDDRNRAAALMSGHGAVQGVEADDEDLIVTSEPGKVGIMAEQVLPLLIREQVVVREFKRRRVDLEEVFFRVLEQHDGSEVRP